MHTSKFSFIFSLPLLVYGLNAGRFYGRSNTHLVPRQAPLELSFPPHEVSFLSKRTGKHNPGNSDSQTCPDCTDENQLESSPPPAPPQAAADGSTRHPVTSFIDYRYRNAEAAGYFCEALVKSTGKKCENMANNGDNERPRCGHHRNTQTWEPGGAAQNPIRDRPVVASSRPSHEKGEKICEAIKKDGMKCTNTANNGDNERPRCGHHKHTPTLKPGGAAQNPIRSSRNRFVAANSLLSNHQLEEKICVAVKKSGEQCQSPAMTTDPEPRCGVHRING